MPRLARQPKAPLVALNMKVPVEIRRRLEAEAEASGRPLTQEVVYQLLAHMNGKDATMDTIVRSLGGKAQFGLFQAMAGMAAVLKDDDDPFSLLAVYKAWDNHDPAASV